MLQHLPDDILCHILSFMPTRHAVRTCTLSKRWRHLWESVSTLDLDDRDFPAGPPPRGFVANATSWTAATQPLLRSFRLCWRYDQAGRRRAAKWITDSLARGVEELDLDLIFTPGCPLRTIFFLARSVVVLRLRLLYTSDLAWPVDDLRLNRLRTLHLSRVSSVASPLLQSGFGETLEAVVAACPVLEELRLRRCTFGTLHISAPKLRKLAVLRCRSNFVTRVSAPALQYFRYDRRRLQEFYFEGPSSLVDASTGMRGDGACLQLGSLVDALGAGIRTVKSLSLSFSSAAELPPEGRYPMFHNLSTLLISTCLKNNDAIRATTFLILHSPNLETLEIRNNEFRHRYLREERHEGIYPNIWQSEFNRLCRLRKVEIKSSADQLTRDDNFVKLLRANEKTFEDGGILSLIIKDQIV